MQYLDAIMGELTFCEVGAYLELLRLVDPDSMPDTLPSTQEEEVPLVQKKICLQKETQQDASVFGLARSASSGGLDMHIAVLTCCLELSGAEGDAGLHVRISAKQGSGQKLQR